MYEAHFGLNVKPFTILNVEQLKRNVVKIRPLKKMKDMV